MTNLVNSLHEQIYRVYVLTPLALFSEFIDEPRVEAQSAFGRLAGAAYHRANADNLMRMLLHSCSRRVRCPIVFAKYLGSCTFHTDPRKNFADQFLASQSSSTTRSHAVTFMSTQFYFEFDALRDYLPQRIFAWIRGSYRPYRRTRVSAAQREILTVQGRSEYRTTWQIVCIEVSASGRSWRCSIILNTSSTLSASTEAGQPKVGDS